MKSTAREGWHRYFAEVAYNGTAYHGWQVQPNAHSVQAEFNLHFSRFFHTDINVVGCGRTDTGVHASRFYLHFDLPEVCSDEAAATYKLSRMLPDDLVVRRIFEVPEDAHARFSATSRSYSFHWHNAKDPFATFSSWVPFELNLEAMQEAAALLRGQRDYAAFCKAGSDVSNTLCTIHHIQVDRAGHAWRLDISANRFLRNMVRAIGGTLVDVGRGYTSLEEFEAIVESGDRSKAGASLSPQGLFLTDVDYPFIG